LARFEQDAIGKDLRAGLGKLDTMMDVFKFSVTGLWPAFHARNAYSNVAQNFISIGAAALNPLMYVKALAVMHGGDATWEVPRVIRPVARAGQKTLQQIPTETVTPLRRYTGEELRLLANQQGILKDFQQLSELRGKASFIRKAPFRWFGAAGAEIENTSRMMLFMKHLQDGATPSQAEALVKKFLFDYESLSKVERQLLSRMIPFYIWNKKNLALTSEQLAKNPGRYANMVKLARPGDRGPEQEALSDYLRGDIKVKINREGGTTFVTGIDLPMNSALDLIYTGDVVETMRRNVGMLGPALKIMIEVPTKTDLFTGRSLEERQYLRGFGRVVDSFPKEIQDFLEYRKSKTKDGKDIYTINGLKAYILVRSYAFSRFYSTFDRLLKEDQTFMSGMLDLVVGLRTKEVEFSEQDERIINNQIRRYQEYLHRKGELREKPIFFKPRKAKEEEEEAPGPASSKTGDPFLDALGIEE
jgi:hypothetical protein